MFLHKAFEQPLLELRQHVGVVAQYRVKQFELHSAHQVTFTVVDDAIYKGLDVGQVCPVSEVALTDSSDFALKKDDLQIAVGVVYELLKLLNLFGDLLAL